MESDTLTKDADVSFNAQTPLNIFDKVFSVRLESPIVLQKKLAFTKCCGKVARSFCYGCSSVIILWFQRRPWWTLIIRVLDDLWETLQGFGKAFDVLAEVEILNVWGKDTDQQANIRMYLTSQRLMKHFGLAV